MRFFMAKEVYLRQRFVRCQFLEWLPLLVEVELGGFPPAGSGVLGATGRITAEHFEAVILVNI
jgi:hypothetical protein